MACVIRATLGFECGPIILGRGSGAGVTILSPKASEPFLLAAGLSICPVK